MVVEGADGKLSYQAPDGTWHDLGPVSETMTVVSDAVQCFEALGSFSATAAGQITKLHWNRLCKALGLPESYYRYPAGPLRKRKHGGRLPSYRDVRQKRRAT